MRAAIVALIILSLAFALAPKNLSIQGLVMCKNVKRVAVVGSQISLKEMATKMSSLYGCIPKVVHFYKAQTEPYFVNYNGENYGWQLDGNHTGLTEAFSYLNNAAYPVEVAVIDTGLAPGAPVNADWTHAIGITALVDSLISQGVCSDYGVANLYNATNIYIPLLFFTINYQFPYNATIYKYCVLNQTMTGDLDGDGTPDSLVIVQLTEPYDVVGHGTFVSSMIAGRFVAANGTSYVTGVAYSDPYVKVIPIRADLILLFAPDSNCNSLSYCLNNTTLYMFSGSFDDLSLEQAANYVVSLKQSLPSLKVVNMSLGGWYSPSDYDYWVESCNERIAPMVSAGLTVVVAAGNEGMELNPNNGYEFPAMCPGVYPVSALTVDNKLADFSNYGSYIKFSAPGDLVYGIYPAHSVLGALEGGTLDSTGNFTLTASSGTSYASPIAAGVVAIAYSAGRNIEDVLEGARFVPPYYSINPFYGYGEVYVPGIFNHTEKLEPAYYSVVPKVETPSLMLTTTQSAGIPAPALLALFFRRRKRVLVALLLLTSALLMADTITLTPKLVNVKLQDGTQLTPSGLESLANSPVHTMSVKVVKLDSRFPTFITSTSYGDVVVFASVDLNDYLDVYSFRVDEDGNVQSVGKYAQLFKTAFIYGAAFNGQNFVVIAPNSTTVDLSYSSNIVWLDGNGRMVTVERNIALNNGTLLPIGSSFMTTFLVPVEYAKRVLFNYNYYQSGTNYVIQNHLDVGVVGPNVIDVFAGDDCSFEVAKAIHVGNYTIALGQCSNYKLVIYVIKDNLGLVRSIKIPVSNYLAYSLGGALATFRYCPSTDEMMIVYLSLGENTDFFSEYTGTAILLSGVVNGSPKVEGAVQLPLPIVLIGPNCRYVYAFVKGGSTSDVTLDQMVLKVDVVNGEVVDAAKLSADGFWDVAGFGTWSSIGVIPIKDIENGGVGALVIKTGTTELVTTTQGGGIPAPLLLALIPFLRRRSR